MNFRVATLGLGVALVIAGLTAISAQTYKDSGGTIVPGVVVIDPSTGPFFTVGNPAYVICSSGCTGGGGGGAVTLASGAVASGAYSSGSIASGAFASGSIGSGAIAANAAASGAFPAGSISDLAHGQGTMAASVPVTIASNQATFPVTATLNQGGSVLSATNGIFDNILQGNAVLSTTNGLYTNLLQGNAVLSATNPLAENLAQVGGVSTSTNPLMVAVSTAPATATNTALTVDLRPDSPGIITLGPAATSSAVPHVLSSQYPVNNNTTTPTAETISATGTTAAFTATLAAGTGSQVTYICGAEIDAAATAGLAVAATITGTITGTLNFVEEVSTLTGTGVGRNVYNFNPCIPGSAAATGIVVHAGAAGSGGISSISAWGYLL